MTDFDPKAARLDAKACIEDTGRLGRADMARHVIAALDLLDRCRVLLLEAEQATGMPAYPACMLCGTVWPLRHVPGCDLAALLRDLGGSDE